MISYRKFFDLLKTRGINITQLRRDNAVTQSALTAMRQNRHINLKTVDRLCEYLKCQPGDIMEYEKEEQ